MGWILKKSRNAKRIRAPVSVSSMAGITRLEEPLAARASRLEEPLVVRASRLEEPGTEEPAVPALSDKRILLMPGVRAFERALAASKSGASKEVSKIRQKAGLKAGFLLRVIM